ncbi:putative HTH-type transcriptional regulator ydhC [Proteiniborus sp. DW1]|uniref:GntR family transcriptional regulator n=1 Tax=Proteiniborus sp. DW1 TaxID=1889883 RepID=UPI00092DEEFD|nr:GntR family transcriptional regulator [Proteiniborus sp. DW1]SCG81772.1 putative HTH-type transcriptional regulator ydhC [Proteiniborus sp. DW1]
MNIDLDKLSLHDYKPLREIVFESIREAIIDGKLKPGERVMEVQLAEKLGVSRTPVREAIRKLELEGLLIMEPRKGAYVADVSLKDLVDVLEVRSSLEGLAASLAATRASEEEIEVLKEKAAQFKECIEKNDVQGMINKDTEFHEAILQAAKNKKLTSIIESLREQLQRFRVTYFTEYNMTTYLASEHQKVLDAIESRDPDKANEYAQQHIENLEKHIVSHIKDKL